MTNEQIENLKHMRRLWNQQMEGSINKAGVKQFDGLMQDPELVEIFTIDRESNTANESALELDWKKIDAKVKQTFYRQSISWLKALMVIAASTLIGLTTANWLMSRNWDPAEQKNDPAWMHEAQEMKTVKPVEKEVMRQLETRHVGAPPAGSDLRVTRGPKGIEVELDQAQAGLASVKVVDASGKLVKTLHQGDLEAGKWHFVWEGLDSAGKNRGPGKYRIQAELAGEHFSEQVEIYAAQ